MPVNLEMPVREALLPVAGVEIGTARAAIRKAGRRDVLLMRISEGASVAGVFTQNRFRAAPVKVCQRHLRDVVEDDVDARRAVARVGPARRRALS